MGKPGAVTVCGLELCQIRIETAWTQGQFLLWYTDHEAASPPAGYLNLVLDHFSLLPRADPSLFYCPGES